MATTSVPLNEDDHAIRLLYLTLASRSLGSGSPIQFRSSARELGALLDAVGEAAVIEGLDHSWCHPNETLVRLLDGAPARVEVEGALRHVVDSLAAVAAGPHRAARDQIRHRTSLIAGGERWELVGLLLESSGGPCAVVTLRPLRTRLPDPDLVARRSSLTPRQAEVALLIAEGLSDKRVAAELGISRHTARRHSEAVLKGLDLHSRREVRDRLLALSLDGLRDAPPEARGRDADRAVGESGKD